MSVEADGVMGFARVEAGEDGDGRVTLLAMDPEPGEEVFFHGHPSWRSMLAFYIKGFLIAVLAGVIAGIVTRIAGGSVSVPLVVAVVLIVFVVLVVTGLIRRIATTYTITNRRLTIDIGLLSRALHETRLERVQNVNTRQSVLERMLRVGTVDFDTAGSADFDFAFRGVDNPREIVRTVDRALHELQQHTPGPRV
jgi:uncharacterized membrane protein YdbT with pleckstrin-like domain